MKCFLNEAIHQGVDSLTTGCPPRIPMIRTLQKQGSSNIKKLCGKVGSAVASDIWIQIRWQFLQTLTFLLQRLCQS